MFIHGGAWLFMGGERVFVHMFTSVVLGPFRGRPVLGDRPGRSVDSTGERMFVFGTFPLVRGYFWGVGNCERNRHVLVHRGMFVVYKYSGVWVEHVFCDKCHTGNVRFGRCVSRESC